jgi:DNA-binding IclR family transcriptional regulator
MGAAESNVDRALGVLRYLAENPGWHGVRSLAVAVDLSPSTVFRLLDALCRTGFAQHDAVGGRYAIGAAAVQLGMAALESLELTSVAPATIEALAGETGESVFVSVLDQGEVVYLMKKEGSRAIRTTAVLGTRRPAHCTALGKAMLASLPPDEVRRVIDVRGLPALTPATITDLAALWEELAAVRIAGYAVDREEVEEGLACIAAPIRDHLGHVVAAVSLAGPVTRVLPQEERLGRRVAAAALEISQGLGYLPKPATVGRGDDGLSLPTYQNQNAR